jgi:nicotinate-nucleotide pyrophosphorylase (carboxylating)
MPKQPEPAIVFPYSVWVDQLVHQALSEDVGAGDVTTALTVDAGGLGEARIVARTTGVLAGLPLAGLVYRQLDHRVRIEELAHDGQALSAGMVIARLVGPARALLTGERTVLNFLQILSGIATETRRYVDALAGTECQVLDTRKTVPGYRLLAKYAVRAGGGTNHRLGLYDRILLKDNHWAMAPGRLADVVARARRNHADLPMEVEVDGLDQLDLVLPLHVDWIMLDNFTPELAATAVQRVARAPAPRPRLEASGNISLSTVRPYAEAGVDAVSVGRLTHSAPALDVAMELDLPLSGPAETS